MTRYVVLSASTPAPSSPGAATREDGQVWKVIKMVDAANHKAAVAAVVKENGATEGTFIATPVRSWKQVKVKTEQRTQVKFS